MKRLVTFALLFLLAVPISSHAQSTGREVMLEQKKRQEVVSEYTKSVMLLVDKKGEKEKRELEEYHKKNDGGEDRSLLVFLASAGIRGTALLTWDHATGPSDQWLYLPAQKRLQRIAQGSKKSYFMGTDFTYEDMEPEDIDNFTYAIKGEEAVDGQLCWKIEAVPANAEKRKQSGYGSRIIWVDKDTYTTVKIEFFDRRGKLVKRQTGRDFVKVKGTAWRPGKTLMDNIKSNHRTLVGVQERTIDEDVDDTVFTERHILSGKHVE